MQDGSQPTKSLQTLKALSQRNPERLSGEDREASQRAGRGAGPAPPGPCKGRASVPYGSVYKKGPRIVVLSSVFGVQSSAPYSLSLARSLSLSLSLSRAMSASLAMSVSLSLCVCLSLSLSLSLL